MAGSGSRITVSGWQDVSTPQWSTEKGHHDDYVGALGHLSGGAVSPGSPTSSPNSFSGYIASTPQDDFFDQMIVIPRSIDAGLVLDTKDFEIDIYSSYKDATRIFQSYLNNAGPGILVPDLPGLPTNLDPQHGLTVTVRVLVDGPPSISGTQDFGFDTVTIYIPITGVRMIVFPFEPTQPLIERLTFLTDVLRKRDGKEQRVALRSAPRQSFEFSLDVNGRERQALNAILFDSQARAFGLPIWSETAILTSDVEVDDDTIYVDTTDYSDFRVGGTAIVWDSFDNYQALEISVITDTTLEFQTTFTKTFPIGSRVMPVRAGYLNKVLRGHKWHQKLQQNRIQFSIWDNDANLSDTSAFSTYNSKVILDEPNKIENVLRESLEHRYTIIDNETGVFETLTDVDVSRHGFSKTFFSNSRQRLWEVRQLMHALKGSATSFYIPTFFDEFEVTQDVTSGSSTLTFRNIGYADYIQDRQPLDVVRLVLTNGTEVIRGVTSSSVIDTEEEQIVVDSSWGVNASVDEIDHVDFVLKVRMTGDEVEIIHTDSLGQAQVYMPLITVFE